MFDAVVLAGGGKVEPLTEQEKVSNKAFILLHNKPLLTYILSALEEAPSVEQIVVVGPANELQVLQDAGYSFEIAQEKGGMLDNLAAGFETVDQNQPCLVVTSDIPLLRADVIEHFLALCAPHDHDFYYPVLSRKTCLESFPDTERTYVRLKEGPVTGGNIGLLRPSWFLNNRERLEMFISYRKKPLKMMRILPLTMILKYLFKTLTVSDLESYLSRLLKLKARAVPCECVEIAVDVDKVNDLELVKKVLQD